MTHAKTIGRRELLRGGGLAALAVAGAAVVPFGAVSASECTELRALFAAFEECNAELRRIDSTEAHIDTDTDTEEVCNINLRCTSPSRRPS